MTSISSLQSFSPLQRLQNELTSEISAGTINASDKSALTDALKDIDSSLKSEMQAGGTPPSPDEMKSKINGLIDKEVSSGKLTSDQADELKNVFANALKGGPGVASSTSSSDSSSDSTDSTSKLMQDFLKLLQDSQSSSSSYGANGSSNLTSQIQSLILNVKA